MPVQLSKRRFAFLSALIVLFFLVIVYQLLQLHWIRRPTLEAIANSQHNLKIEIPPVRGPILDRNGKELAVSLKVPSVYGVPRLIGQERKRKVAKDVSRILKLEESWVLERLSRDKAFIWLKRKVTFEEAEAIRELGEIGLGIRDEYKRFYPQGELMAQLLGFVDPDNSGLEGLERIANAHLQGREGLRLTKRDALGREIRAFEVKAIPALDGNRVHLTIDQYLQYLTERSLEAAVKQWKPEGAAAILMEAETGRILAMANQPTFDPNRYSASRPDERRNRVVTDMYEPGSVFKIVAASAALNEGKVTMETEIHCENGEYRYGSRTLHDVHPYGKLTFQEVIIKSSNIGTVKIAAMLEPNVFHDYVKRFGFGRNTGVDLAGEAPGFINPPSRWSKTSPYNIPMGHEVMVTLIQVARAMAVIANGGKLVTPYIVEKIEDQAGVIIREHKPEPGEQVIKPETAHAMQQILQRVVEEGTGKKAIIPGIPVGGKTGTAQKVLPNGRGYSHSNFISSFVGFGPSDGRGPALVMAVMMDDPKPLYYGGTVAAPVFREVMEAAILATGYVPASAAVLEPPSVKLEEIPEHRPITLPASVPDTIR